MISSKRFANSIAESKLFNILVTMTALYQMRPDMVWLLALRSFAPTKRGSASIILDGYIKNRVYNNNTFLFNGNA